MDGESRYLVVMNHEEQYSIWPAEREIPGGWRAEGTSGPKEDCLRHIDQVWTDMRPLSLRRHMERTAADDRAGSGHAVTPAADGDAGA